jgi:hypothetical protein
MPKQDETTNPGIVTTELLYKEIRAQRKDTGSQLEVIDNRIRTQGERLVRVETKVDDMAPKVKEAFKMADSAKSQGDRLSGQWKILATILLSAAMAVGGWLIREMAG